MYSLGFELKPELTSAILSICGKNLKLGRQMHALLACNETLNMSALVDTYSRCFDWSTALLVFNDITESYHVSWTAMIAGCAMKDKYCMSLDYLRAMQTRDVVLWSSIIGSYSCNGDITGAMKHFHQMRMEGINPNSVTLLRMITACINESHGCGIHELIVKSGFSSHVFVGNSLIDMYAKCGYLEASHQMFREIPERNYVSWTAMIRGYSLHGYGIQALKLFQEMQEANIVLPFYQHVRIPV
ncbi:hypothetical protein GIB67_016891 [Kingdonia uniflora]|uniref:Pentatricopeptide repeat-containing protein n=1 Tax=Kingdonia uniflora TaxID=39325 RepID=A0A7J7M395_9MAGN|nr:hypothetical protein GIB67_016891 [Kingdonia uniflora]